MNAADRFNLIYHTDPTYHAFTTYRICTIGAHSDHQYGKITGMAIDKGVHIAYDVKRNGVVELVSMQFEKRAQWYVNALPDEFLENDWADYLRGATKALSEKYPLRVGLRGVIEGELPIGGLSSSAAVIIAFLTALCKVNNIHLSEQELIMIALRAEKDYVGVSVGKLDQSCEILSRKDQLLYLDTRNDSYELIPTSPNMKPYEIAIFFSGLERNLLGSKFNMRVDECRSAGYALMAYAGMEYGKFKDTFLRNIPREVFEAYRDRLPENWAKRAEHFYTELERVEKGAEAWRRGDMEAFGQLSFESGYSSIYNYETGSPELKKIYEIMRDTKGIYGGRFSGAGFKGCCMALVDPVYREDVLAKVEREYLAAFPEMEGKFATCICHSADGVGSI